MHYRFAGFSLRKKIRLAVGPKGGAAKLCCRRILPGAGGGRMPAGWQAKDTWACPHPAQVCQKKLQRFAAILDTDYLEL